MTMKTTLKRMIVLSLVALAATLAPAIAWAGTWTEYFDPGRIYLHDDYVLVNYAGGTPLEGCMSLWIQIDTERLTKELYDETLTLVLFAKATGTRIKMYVWNCQQTVSGSNMLLHPDGHVVLE